MSLLVSHLKSSLVNCLNKTDSVGINIFVLQTDLIYKIMSVNGGFKEPVFALKGPKPFYSYLLSLKLVLCRVAAVKCLPALILSADFIVLLVL